MILPVLVCAGNKKIMLSQRREFCSGCETFCANERRTELVPALPSAADTVSLSVSGGGL